LLSAVCLDFRVATLRREEVVSTRCIGHCIIFFELFGDSKVTQLGCYPLICLAQENILRFDVPMYYPCNFVQIVQSV
jgi:hypothetical protein